MEWELKVLDYIEKHFHSDRRTVWMKASTLAAEKGVFLGICILIMGCFKKTRKAAVAAGMSLILEVLVCNALIKPSVDRTRPYDNKKKPKLLIPELKDASFPSGHTSAAFSVVGGLFFSKTKLWIPAAMMAVSTAFSRMYFYVHYPTDILGGMIVGLGSGWMAVKIQNMFMQR